MGKRDNSIRDLSSMISVEKLHCLFREENGVLFRRAKTKGLPANKHSVPAGSLLKTGYRLVCIENTRVLEHRIVWAMHHGKWPSSYLDHLNGNRSDNRIENLREVSKSENAINKSSHRSGRLPGIHRKKRGWKAGLPSQYASGLSREGKKTKRFNMTGIYKTQESAWEALSRICPALALDHATAKRKE